jgi:hypothetical protein
MQLETRQQALEVVDGEAQSNNTVIVVDAC